MYVDIILPFGRVYCCNARVVCTLFLNFHEFRSVFQHLIFALRLFSNQKIEFPFRNDLGFKFNEFLQGGHVDSFDAYRDLVFEETHEYFMHNVSVSCLFFRSVEKWKCSCYVQVFAIKLYVRWNNCRASILTQISIESSQPWPLFESKYINIRLFRRRRWTSLVQRHNGESTNENLLL